MLINAVSVVTLLRSMLLSQVTTTICTSNDGDDGGELLSNRDLDGVVGWRNGSSSMLITTVAFVACFFMIIRLSFGG